MPTDLMRTPARPAGALPPGPAGDAHLRTMRDAPLAFITELAGRYGDVTCHRAGGDTVYMVNRPDLARHVLKDNGANYTKERTPDDNMLRPLLGNGLLTSNGADWARQRHMCAPAFRPAAVRTFDGIVTDATGRLLDRWRTAAGAPIAVDHHLTALTLEVIVRAMLGAEIGGIGERFGQAVDAVNRFIGHYVPADDPDPADTARRHAGFVRARAFLDMVTRTLVASRRAAGPAGSDLLGTLLDAAGDDPAGGDPAGGDPAGGAGGGGHGGGHPQVSDTELRDQVLTIIMAGHETTAKSLTWALYLLDRHPDEAARVRDEVDRVLGGRLPTAADLADLAVCQRVIKEAMRLYPPVWLISRRATGPDELDGYPVAPGTLVCISQYLLHRDPRYWTDPERFWPDRFTPQRAAGYPSHLYLPFGGGDRICIGQHFAMVEATLVLAMLAQSVRLSLVPGHVVEPEALVTLRPRYGMSMLAGPR